MNVKRFRLRRHSHMNSGVSFQDNGRHAAPTMPSIGAGLPPSRHRRGIYLLPNAFTTGNLFAGFYAIVMAMNGEFQWAAIAIFLAMFLDSLDGRVARLTNSQSTFGEQYDSLADMISFGAAPALVIYSWALTGLGKWGWLAAFIYVAGAALRLARFNTNIQVVDRRYFQGLPSPAAAALVAGLVWLATDWHNAHWIAATGADLGGLAWLMTVYAGLTMVSNSPFYSFKDFNLRRSVPFVVLILLMLALVLVSSDPPSILFLLFMGYGISGHVLKILRYMRRRRRKAAGLHTLVRASVADDDAAPDAEASSGSEAPATTATVPRQTGERPPATP